MWPLCEYCGERLQGLGVQFGKDHVRSHKYYHIFCWLRQLLHIEDRYLLAIAMLILIVAGVAMLTVFVVVRNLLFR